MMRSNPNRLRASRAPARLLAGLLLPLLASCGGAGGAAAAGAGTGLAIEPAQPRIARAGWPYRERLEASGGSGPCSLELLEHDLPPGLEYRAATQEVLGLPAATGQGSLRVRARDSSSPPRTFERTLTFAVAEPWSEAAPAAGPYALLFIHHSVGWNLMYRSGAQGLAAVLFGGGYLPFSLTYGQGEVDGYVIGDHTDVPDWPVNFNTPAYFEKIAAWTEPQVALPSGRHDLVLFKSCYPNSNLPDEGLVEEFKAHYLSLLPTFAAHPQTLFVLLTTPPLHPLATLPDRAARARALSRWLRVEFASLLPNLAVFDLFDLLANPPGHPGEPNMLKAEYRTGDGDSHPTAASDPVAAEALRRFLNAALRAWGREP